MTMMELRNVGKDMPLIFNVPGRSDYEAKVKVQMVIKAPRGTMALFDNKYVSPDSQCEGIRAFMEEHRDD